MLFGLKTAPFPFQKAITRIFEPILSSSLVYIDDILLFSENVDSHPLLLQIFHSLVQDYGMMLSEEKIKIGEASIEFLGMKISQGQYQLQPRIASQLDTFPDSNLSVKKIQ